jgi:hypothetical protein
VNVFLSTHRKAPEVENPRGLEVQLIAGGLGGHRADVLYAPASLGATGRLRIEPTHCLPNPVVFVNGRLKLIELILQLLPNRVQQVVAILRLGHFTSPILVGLVTAECVQLLPVNLDRHCFYERKECFLKVRRQAI